MVYNHMKNLPLIIIVFLAVYTTAFSQQKAPNCGWYGTKTVAERNVMFPFNKVKKVLLVSFANGDMHSNGDAPDSVAYKVGTRIYGKEVIKKRSFTVGGYQKEYYIVEEEKLSQKSIDELSNIMFNYIPQAPWPQGMPQGVTDCYNPHNAVLFLDEDKEVIACFEICFSCGGAYLHPDDYNINDRNFDCGGFMRLLYDFFKKEKITFGPDRE